jgi:hypothetical protein
LEAETLCPTSFLNISGNYICPAQRLRSSFIRPEIPTPVPEPPSGEGWIHEIKHDGYRTLIVPTISKSLARSRKDGPPGAGYSCCAPNHAARGQVFPGIYQLSRSQGHFKTGANLGATAMPRRKRRPVGEPGALRLRREGKPALSRWSCAERGIDHSTGTAYRHPASTCGAKSPQFSSVPPNHPLLGRLRTRAKPSGKRMTAAGTALDSPGLPSGSHGLWSKQRACWVSASADVVNPMAVGPSPSGRGQGQVLRELPVLAYADRVHGGPELVGGLQENFASYCNYIQNPETIDWLRRIPNGPPASAPIMLARCRSAASLDHGDSSRSPVDIE